ncbi:DUF6879 family protein [Nocardiopsis sp. FR4]|uniref:DUF6879 family protein n=1 Tax=Nocardiopsis sp. FR4 TaxID=2605985 RepID=UPI00135877CD|nr:DUF6879 family protein [Nocardiopsis sp. FR4]
MPASTSFDLTAIRTRSDLLAEKAHRTHLTRDEARHLTGWTGAELTRLALDNVVQAEYSGKGYTRFSTASLLRLMRRRRQPFSLFDVVRSAADGGQRLTDDALAVDEATTRNRRDLQARRARCYRLVRRDHVVPTDPAWSAWYQGRTTLAEHLLGQERERRAIERAEFAAYGLPLTTLWIPTLPLTSYGRYTRAVLAQAHRAGQRVRVGSSDQVRHMEAEEPLPEVTVYEAAVVYLHTYTRLGRRDGAIRIVDPDLATHLCEQMKHLCRTAATLNHLQEAA